MMEQNERPAILELEKFKGRIEALYA